MLEKDLKSLDDHIKNINVSLEAIYQTIDSILSHPMKNYDLTYKKQRYYLYTPFDKKEEKELRKLRNSYLRNIIKYVMNKRIGQLKGDQSFFPIDTFDILYAFGYCEDPRNHQFEKSDFKEIQSASDETFGSSRPLDLNNYQVKIQQNDIYSEDDFIEDEA